MESPPKNSAVRHAKREAIVVAVIGVLALAYTVGYCSLYAYDRPWEDVKFVLGFPDWVFWGLFTPWAVCLVVSWWFAYRFMVDDDLGPEHAAPDDDESGREGA